MYSIKIVGSIVAILMLAGTFWGIQEIVKSDANLAKALNVDLKRQMQLKIDPEDKLFQVESIRKEEGKKVITTYFPVKNPCGIFWEVVDDPFKPTKNYQILYYSDSRCDLDSEKIYASQYRIVNKIFTVIDIKRVESVTFSSGSYIHNKEGRQLSGSSFMKELTGKKELNFKVEE